MKIQRIKEWSMQIEGEEIRNAQDDLILSDNFFDMDPGSRRVTVVSGNLEDIRLRSVYDIR